ncbi:MAG: TRAP transporter small permease [Eubacteriales bacterium]|nr:TRAP transporter small permease [Eubacteriales bacterium]
MKSLDKTLSAVEDWISVATFVIMLTLAFANVFSRFVLHASLAFTDEFVTVLFVLCSLAGSSIGQRNRAHLGLDFFTGFLPEKTQKIILVIGNILALIFLVIMFVYGIGMVKQEFIHKQLSTTMQYPQWIYGLTIPIGSGIMILRYIIDTVLKCHDVAAVGKE